jgi:hypothetical protein
MNPVLEMIKADQCRVVEVTTETGPALIRFRTPVLGGQEVPGYPWRLVALWPYAEAGSGALPSPQASEEMETFEDRICEAFETDAHAVLVAVLTFDGARQWVFYTRGIEECSARLEAMPQEEQPYPIELEACEDRRWLYLREEILAQVDFEA